MTKTIDLVPSSAVFGSRNRRRCRTCMHCTVAETRTELAGVARSTPFSFRIERRRRRLARPAPATCSPSATDASNCSIKTSQKRTEVSRDSKRRLSFFIFQVRRLHVVVAAAASSLKSSIKETSKYSNHRQTIRSFLCSGPPSSFTNP